MMTSGMWSEIAGWPGYEIGRNGQLRSWLKSPNEKTPPDRPRLLKGGVDKDGYRRAVLCNGKTRKSLKIHHLVLDTFMGKRPAGTEARHKNGDKTDNRLSNLEWSNHHENILDKIKHGTIARGERHGTSVLKKEQVKKIFLSRNSRSSLAKRYGVHKSSIDAIKTGRYWTWLTKDL